MCIAHTRHMLIHIFLIYFIHKLFFSVGFEYQFADYTTCTNTQCTHRRLICKFASEYMYMVSNSLPPDNTALYVPVLRRRNTWSRTPFCPHHSMPWVQSGSRCPSTPPAGGAPLDLYKVKYLLYMSGSIFSNSCTCLDLY